MNESSLKRAVAGRDIDQDPAAVVAAIEARGTRHETPCGAGYMVWRRWGAGPPVILVHGGFGSWTHWIRNIDALSAHYTVWAIDIPGMGESAPPEPLTMEGITDAVERGLHSLIPGNERVNVVGFSFGSSISAMLAARLKDRLGNLVLMGGRFAQYSKRVSLHTVKWKLIDDPAERLAAHRSNLAVIMIADPKNVDELAVHLQSVNTQNARIAARKWTPSPSDKLHEYFSQIRAPGRITVLFGRGDAGSQTMVETNGAALRGPQPDVKFHIIEHAGHWVQYEAAEAINKLLLATLSSGG